MADEECASGKAIIDGQGQDGCDGDCEDEEADMKPIVSLEETDEELMVAGESPPRRRPGRRAAERGGASACRLECAECRERFTDAASLERHAMMHMVGADNDGDRPFKCDVCLRGFNRKDKLKLHLMIHRGDKPLKCDVCGKAFLRRDHLKNHIKTHSTPKHTSKLAAKQQRRERGGGLDDGASDREKAEPPERPFGCDVCHKMFSRKDNLAAHMRIHTGEKPFGCDLCGKCFAEKCALKRHMVVHTQEKLYPCSICGRAFARKGHLTEHVWLHDEVKPFLCNVCGKAFARDRKLKSHMMTHSGERPYKCDVCERAFARKDNLKSHLSLHYGIKTTRAPRPRPSDQDPMSLPLAHGVGLAVHSVAATAMAPCSVPLPVALPATSVPASHPQQLLGHPLLNPMGVDIGLGPLGVNVGGVGVMGQSGVSLGVSMATSGVSSMGVGLGLVPS